MKKFILIIISSLVLLATQEKTSEDFCIDPKTRIFGGEYAASKQFPWLASVCSKRKMCCAGSIISSRWILTTAWCLTNNVNATGFLATIGTEAIRGGFATTGSVFVTGNVTKIHKDYSGAPLYLHNIGLLKLLHNVEETDYIKYIRLPKRFTRDYAGETASFAAWGITAKDESCTKITHSDVVVLSNEQCLKDYQKGITNSTICTMSNSTHTSSPGDSGGSLTILEKDNIPTIIGVRSVYLQHPKTDFKNSYPNAFVRIPDYLAWIHYQTGIPMCSERNWDNTKNYNSST